MSVVLEFTIDAGAFTLGRVLSGTGMRVELERVVPTGTQMFPFVWATGPNHETFEANVSAHPRVAECVVLDRVGDGGLYRVEWVDAPADLVDGIDASAASVLQARGNGTWAFRLRFRNHDDLSAFHDYCTDRNVPIRVERTSPFHRTGEDGRRFDLSRAQREALVLALRQGYFATPSEVTLDDLAAELGISRQALSKRIRRGNETVLRGVLLPAEGDD